MQITIGEITNELMKYSNVVNMSMANGLPFVKTYLSTGSNYTRAYMYVVQTSEGKYSASVDIDDSNGSRFFPTGSISRPLIRELDKIHELFGGNTTLYAPWASSIKDASYVEFMDWFYDRLIIYELIRANQNTLNTRMLSLGFNSVKIQRTIEKAFIERNARSGTIGDLVNIVNKRRERFNISGLRNKEVQCVVSKLKDVGILISTNEDCITDVTFDRRQH